MKNHEADSDLHLTLALETISKLKQSKWLTTQTDHLIYSLYLSAVLLLLTLSNQNFYL